jgi:hypothetical protein
VNEGYADSSLSAMPCAAPPTIVQLGQIGAIRHDRGKTVATERVVSIRCFEERADRELS